MPDKSAPNGLPNTEHAIFGPPLVSPLRFRTQSLLLIAQGTKNGSTYIVLLLTGLARQDPASGQGTGWPR